MFRSELRWLPAIAVTGLVVAAGVAPIRDVGASRPALETDYATYSICTPLQQGSVDSPYQILLDPGMGVDQPIAPLGNIASCSLLVQPSVYCGKRVQVFAWDPLALAPDPSTVSLRTFSYPATDVAFNATRLDMVPAVITKSAPGVAEEPPVHLAIEYRIVNGLSEIAKFEPNSNAAAPTGFFVHTSGERVPLGGQYPVLAHSICGGDEALQSLRVAQCVQTTNAALDPAAYQYVQKFQVPVETSIRWFEFAFESYRWVGTLDYGSAEVYDAQGQSEPPATLDSPLFSASFYFSVYGYPSTWKPHSDPGPGAVLQPNHDYWLSVTTKSDYKLIGRMLTGTESPYFQARIGGLYNRFSASEPFATVNDRVMAFRAIGLPVGTVGVEPPVSRTGAVLRLAASPNPSRGATVVSWTGARDEVRFEVMDARGRRVSSGAAGIGATGQWRWNGRGDDGHALPAGMYFVRARDGAGRSASVRVTLVR